MFSLIKHFCVVILCMRVSESEKPSERGIKGTNRERERERGRERGRERWIERKRERERTLKE